MSNRDWKTSELHLKIAETRERARSHGDRATREEPRQYG